MMNISKVSTTVREEMCIMSMDQGNDWEWCMHPDVCDEYFEQQQFKEYQEKLEMESKGFILNPYYDEDYTYHVWKYDLDVSDWFVHKKYIKPEELTEYNAMDEVVSFGHTLYERLLNEEERAEDYKIYCEECWKAA